MNETGRKLLYRDKRLRVSLINKKGYENYIILVDNIVFVEVFTHMRQSFVFPD